MDNPETTPSEAVDVTASADNVATETQPVEAEVLSAGNEEEAGTVSNPWDSDDRFKGKSPEDIWKAYQGAEKLVGKHDEYTKAGKFIQEKFGVTPEEFIQRAQAQEEQQRRERYADNPMAEVYDELANLKRAYQQQEAEKAMLAEQREVDKFVSENPEFKPFKDKILNLGLNLERGKTYEEIANEYFGQARAQGQQDAYQRIENKKVTQSSGTKSTPQKNFTAEDLASMSVSELETILPKRQNYF